ncbi:surface antigen-like protein [Algoriphagus ratkowskyi]|uniref:BamA/TamA family outer membrane protein n=1 Tax=Algoriphagus ratkowskyi TaxID=57028 RepID=A0A2W7RF34_9BACT|nr:BamA/TamA family outer membrane protein [Algoriphagus ratkowskyi]PZX57736.1 surface antigen-like protein [Algoriphagus ratkowskyi]TXD79003.1 BamA/TamA family outer membrane protein [Algoriphagus ratkowskyi]
MNRITIFLLFFWISSPILAQDTIVYKSNQIRDFKLIPLPAIASNPANGWLFGIAPSATWRMGNPERTHLSNLVGNLLYTTKKQWLISSRSNIFLADDNWILVGDWRYFITSQPTFGLGSSTPNSPQENPNQPGVWWGEQQMDYNWVRFYETVLKRISSSKFYLGVGYHLDIYSKIDNFMDAEVTKELTFSNDYYNQRKGINLDKNTVSGITLNAVMENRDLAVSPYETNFALISFKINPEFLGSNQSSSTLLLDYRHYFPLSQTRKRHLLAVWSYGNFLVSGHLPYMALPSIGYDMFGRAGRGYSQGRFRGENMVYSEAEYRFPLQKNKETFGGTVFVNAASFGSKLTKENLFAKINPGYGLGFRVMINKENRTTISADYGFGQKGNSGFYLNINESF